MKLNLSSPALLTLLSFCIFNVSAQSVENKNVCVNSSCGTLGTSLSTQAEKQLANNTAFKLYPNPSQGKFRIAIEERPLDLANSKVEVYDEEGQVVYSSSFYDHEIDVTKFSKGIYTIKLFDNEHSYKNRVVVQ